MVVELYLSEQHRALRASVREFAHSEVASGAEERDRERRFPYELVAQLAHNRWMGIPFAAEHGGLGADTLAFVIAVEELAVVDPALAATVSAHTWMGTMPLHLWGSEEQRARWLPWLCSGLRLGAFGSSPGAEPTRTTAELHSGTWILDGEEHSVLNAGTATSSCLTATVVTAPGDGRPELSSVIVPSDAPGYSIGDAAHGVGWCSTDSRAIDFTDCHVDEEALLGPRGDGLNQYLKVIEGNRIGLAAIGVGLAQGALDQASAELQRRHEVPGALPRTELQAAVVDLSAQIEATRLLTWRSALERDHGRPFALTAAQARLAGGRLALVASEVAMQAHGGFGQLDEGATWRLFRDARALSISDGSEDAQRAVVASELGFAASPVAAVAPPAPATPGAGVPVGAGAPPAALVPTTPAGSAPEPAASGAPGGVAGPTASAPGPEATPEQVPEAPSPEPAPPPDRASPPALRPPATAAVTAFLATERGIAVTGVGIGVVTSLLLLHSWHV